MFVLKNLETRFVSFIPVIVFLLILLQGLWSRYSPHWLCNAISFLCFICLCAFASNIVRLMDGLELFHQDNLYLFVGYENCLGRVRGV
jgi:cbb3-type cytochrome oxidase subunit 3